MQKRLFRLTPFAEVDPDHPLFRYETSRLRCVHSRSAFERYTLRWLGVGAAIGTGLLGAIYLLLDVTSVNGFRVPPPIPLLCAIAIMASMALGMVLDYAAGTAGLGAAIYRDLIGERWSLLRVTPLHEGGVILAKYAAAQCRGWRSAMIMVGLRASFGVIWFAALVIAGMPSLIALMTPILVTGFVLEEPIKRLRSASALGMYVSARVSGGLGGHLMLLAYLSAFWLAQLILLLSATLIAGPFALLLLLGLDGVFSVFWMFYIPLIAVISIGFASIIRAWALRATMRALAHHDERR
jgi:hypothetical protein